MHVIFKSTDYVERETIEDLYREITWLWKSEEYITNKGSRFKVEFHDGVMTLEFVGKRRSLLDAKPLPFSFDWGNSSRDLVSIWYNNEHYYYIFEVTFYYTSTPKYWHMRWYEELIPCKYLFKDESIGSAPVFYLYPHVNAENWSDLDDIPRYGIDINDEKCSVIYNRVTRTFRAFVPYSVAYQR